MCELVAALRTGLYHLPLCRRFLICCSDFELATTRLRRGCSKGFATQLAFFARQNLHRQLRQKIDPEDIVPSVFRIFFRRNVAGEFLLSDWEVLWGLLGDDCLRKCCSQVDCHGAARCDYRRKLALDDVDSSPHAAHLPADVPTASEAAAFLETMELLMRELDARGKQVLLLRLKDYSVRGISSRSEWTQRTVFRTLETLKVA